MEDSFDNIISYRPLDRYRQGPIDDKEPKESGVSHTNLDSGRPSTTTPRHSPQPPPHIIPCNDESLSPMSSITIIDEVAPPPPTPTEKYSEQPSYDTPQKPINVTAIRCIPTH